MGNCGENTAEKYNISREAQDSHAIESYKRAARAWEAGAFNAEIAPVTIKGKKGDTVVKEDEEYKRVIFEKIPTLNPSFKKQGGTITPANSSSLNDGASALILMSAEKAKELGVKPLAKVICMLDYCLRMSPAYIVFQHTPTLAWIRLTSPLPRQSPYQRHWSAPTSRRMTLRSGRSTRLSPWLSVPPSRSSRSTRRRST